MSDLYTEEIVKKEKTMKDTVIRVLLIAGTAVAVLSLMVLGWLSIILIIAFAVADYFVLPTLELEYEYLYVNGEIDIDKIMSKQKRKRVFSGDDFSSGKKDAKTYTMILKKDQGMEMVIFEPGEVMLKDMKRMAPREVHLQ